MTGSMYGKVYDRMMWNRMVPFILEHGWTPVNVAFSPRSPVLTMYMDPMGKHPDPMYASDAVRVQNGRNFLILQVMRS